MKKEKFILTDFNLPRWRNTDINSVAKIVESFKGNTILGELGHPIDESKDDIIDLKNVVVEISNIILENKVCYGDLKFIDNIKGLEAKYKIDNGGRLSVRAEASGNKFTKIVTWDVV